MAELRATQWRLGPEAFVGRPVWDRIDVIEPSNDRPFIRFGSSLISPNPSQF
jgi:hypothetical protein